MKGLSPAPARSVSLLGLAASFPATSNVYPDHAMPNVFDAAATAALLPYVPLSEEIAATLARKASGGVVCPERLSLALPDGGLLLVMPASDGLIAATKLITVCPGNKALGLPLITGAVHAVRARTGEPLGSLDGPEVTAHRTAAASLLAARHLAPQASGPLLVVGAGVQALAHAMAFASGLGVERVFVAARRRDRAAALAQRLRAHGVEAHDVERPSDVQDQVGLIVTATASPEPVLGDVVREDAFIAAVGSFHPERAEIPATLARRCRIFVDDLEAARGEAGDLLRACVDWERVTPLSRLCLSREKDASGLAQQGPVLYKAVGCAALDLAAARMAFGTHA